MNNVQFTSLLSLARLLAADLKLNRPSLPGGPGPRSKALHVSQGFESVGSAKTLDEHRALVCYWYLNSMFVLIGKARTLADSSSIVTFFHKLDSIPWSPYLEESYQILAASSDREDRWTTALTKIQLVTERISQSPWHDKLPSITSAPPALYLHSFKQQLNEIEATFAVEINENGKRTSSINVSSLSDFRPQEKCNTLTQIHSGHSISLQ